ncbi:MAG: hypothetical protein CMJ78_05785 [Planctomycetaceae bacterium]|nr:hypothetical protein [Planctomycetaceae bacterium]
MVEKTRPPWFWVAVLSIAVGLATLVSWGTTVWNERPLGTIHRHLEVKDFRRALSLANAYLDEFPDHSRAQSLKAQALAGMERWVEATELFEVSGAAEPDEVHIWATALLHQQQWKDALPLLQETLNHQPNNADALHEVTACHMQLGNHEAALATAERFQLQPNCGARGNLLIGTIHRNLNNNRSAVEAWRKVVELNPNADDLQIPAEDFFAEFGMALMNIGEVSEATQNLNRSVIIRPRATNYVELSDGYAQLGKVSEAETALQKALALDESNWQAREKLAELALRQEDTEQALQWLVPLFERPDLRSSTAYLAQRTFTVAGDKHQASKWQTKTQQLRKREQIIGTINHVLVEVPQSFWAQAIRAYRFAEAGNWPQAQAAVLPLMKDGANEPFVKDLIECIRTRGPLPSLDTLPIEQF